MVLLRYGVRTRCYRALSGMVSIPTPPHRVAPRVCVCVCGQQPLLVLHGNPIAPPAARTAHSNCSPGCTCRVHSSAALPLPAAAPAAPAAAAAAAAVAGTERAQRCSAQRSVGAASAARIEYPPSRASVDPHSHSHSGLPPSLGLRSGRRSVSSYGWRAGVCRAPPPFGRVVVRSERPRVLCVLSMLCVRVRVRVRDCA